MNAYLSEYVPVGISKRHVELQMEKFCITV